MAIIQTHARLTADLFFGTANYTAFDLTGIRVFEHQTETYVPMKIFNSMFTKHFFGRCPFMSIENAGAVGTLGDLFSKECTNSLRGI